MRRFVVVALGALVISSAAPAMPVSTFLAKAESLKKKGPLALFSGDLKLLAKQVQSDAARLRDERLAAKAAGKQPGYCPPESGVKMDDKDVLAAMQAVQPAARAKTDTRDALRALMVRKFPCQSRS